MPKSLGDTIFPSEVHSRVPGAQCLQGMPKSLGDAIFPSEAIVTVYPPGIILFICFRIVVYIAACTVYTEIY